MFRPFFLPKMGRRNPRTFQILLTKILNQSSQTTIVNQSSVPALTLSRLGSVVVFKNFPFLVQISFYSILGLLSFQGEGTR